MPKNQNRLQFEIDVETHDAGAKRRALRPLASVEYQQSLDGFEGAMLDTSVLYA